MVERRLELNLEPRKQLNAFVVAAFAALAAGFGAKNLLLPVGILLFFAVGVGSTAGGATWLYLAGIGKPKR